MNIVITRLIKIADSLKKLAMAASKYDVNLEGKKLTISRPDKKKTYTFDNYDIGNQDEFKKWVIENIIDEEHLLKGSADQIVLEVFTEVKKGKKDFTIKFYNIESKVPVTY